MMSMFLLDWYITLFAKSLPLDIATRIWDLYFLEGEILLYKVTVAIFKYFEKKLLDLDFEHLTHFLTHLGQYLNPSIQQIEQGKGSQFMAILAEDVDEQKFFDNVRHLKMTTELFSKAKEAADKQVTSLYGKPTGNE